MSTIISAVLTVGLSRPVYPQLQTCRCTALTDAMCQEQKSDALVERVPAAFRVRDRHDIA
jgi:hypothetical protein